MRKTRPKNISASVQQRLLNLAKERHEDEARMGPARIPLQIDVAFGDALIPSPEKARLKTLLEFPAPALLVCPWKTVIAEKLQALVELGMANSRMKDFYDLYYLAMHAGFDGVTLSRAIRATFRRRRTPLPDTVPTGMSEAFSAERKKQAQWQAFMRRMTEETAAVELEDLLQRLRDFLLPPIQASLKRRRFTKKWRPGGPWRAK